MDQMHWLNRFKCKIVVGGAAISPLLAASSLSLVDGGLTAAAIGFASSVSGSWFADETRDWLKQPVPEGSFNHDLRRAMATALLNCLTESSEQPAPLLRALRDSPLPQKHAAALIEDWKKRVRTALDAQDGHVSLDALFPAIDEPELSALAQQQDLAPRQLWVAFYDQAMACDLKFTMRVDACGGLEALREHVPAALAHVFPQQLAEILKSDEGKRAWIAFQKGALEQLRIQLGDSDERVQAELAAFEAKVDNYALAQLDMLEHLHFGIDGLLAQTGEVLRAIERHSEWMDALRQAMRREHDPPLYVPRADSTLPDGIRALNFKQRLLGKTFGYEIESAALDRFLDADEVMCWWGIVASTGMGKSHLALNLIERCQQLGWRAGFLEPGSSWIGNDTHVNNWQPQSPTLIVIDYASARAGALLSLICRLWERREQLPRNVRVLLLDRPGAIAPLFSELIAHARPEQSQQDRAVEALYRPHDRTDDRDDKSKELRPLASSKALVRDEHLLCLSPLSRVQWRPLLQKALEYFGDNRGLPGDEDPLWSRIDTTSEHGRPLMLLMVAQAMAQDTAQPELALSDGQLNELLSALLEREREKVWADAAGVPREEWNRSHRHRFERAIGLISLLRGVNWPDESSAMLDLMNAQEAEAPALRDQLAAILGLDTNRKGWLRPLEPDLFAEYLLASADDRDEFGEAMLDLPQLVRSAMEVDGLRVAETLILMAREFPKETVPWLHQAIVAYRNPPGEFALTIESAHSISALPRFLILAGDLASISVGMWAALQEVVLAIAMRSPTSAYAALLGLFQAHRSHGDAGALFLAEDVGPGSTREQHILFAMGAVNAIADYGKAQSFDQLDRWGEQLRTVAKSELGRDDREIQLLEVKGAVNAINQYGRAQAFAELERWGERLRTVAKSELGRDDREIQRREAKGAVNAIAHYGKAQAFDQLERWGERLRTVAESELGRDDREIQLIEAKGAVNAINDYGTAQSFDQLERWGERLRTVTESELGRDDREIQLVLAMGAVNAIIPYGKAQASDQMERWGERLRTVAESELGRDDREIQLLEAKGAVNAINHYGMAQAFAEIERWSERLRTVAESELGRVDREIQLLKAKGAVNAIIHYGTAQAFDQMESWGERLRTVAESELGRDDHEIQLLEAKGAVNAIAHYGTAQVFDQMERWGERLQTVAESEVGRDDREIQLQEAKGAVNAIIGSGTAQALAQMERWGERLRTVAESELGRDDREIQQVLATGAVNVIDHYGTAKAFDQLNRWGERLRTVAESELGRDDREIQLIEARAAVNAIAHYGTAQAFAELERWGERLQSVAASVLGRVDREIQLREAMGALNAIADYGKAQAFDQMERWGERLRTAADSELGRDDREFQLVLAMGAVNAIAHYGTARTFDQLERWGGWLRTVAESELGRDDREIQLQLANAAVNAIAHYGAVQAFDAQERWSKRLQTVEGKFGHDDRGIDSAQ